MQEDLMPEVLPRDTASARSKAPQPFRALAGADTEQLCQRFGPCPQPHFLLVRQLAQAPPVAPVIPAAPRAAAAMVRAGTPVTEQIVERDADDRVFGPIRRAPPLCVSHSPRIFSLHCFASSFRICKSGE